MCPSSRRGSITAARPWVPARCFVPAATGPPTWRRSSRSIAASARRNRKTSRPNDSCRSRLAQPREQQTTGHEKRQQSQDRQALIVDQQRLEERRVGNEGVRKGRDQGSQEQYKEKTQRS